MLAGQRHWIDLLNAQDSWKTDDSMLRIIPEDAREFASAEPWPKLKALAFLHNNVQALRLNYTRLEAGETLDLDLINPVLEGVTVRLMDPRSEGRTGEPLGALRVVLRSRGFNAGTAHLRLVVQRAVYHFGRYLELRLADPAYPGSTVGMYRVLPCAAPGCRGLSAAPVGIPTFCSEMCAEDTGRLS